MYGGLKYAVCLWLGIYYKKTQNPTFASLVMFLSWSWMDFRNLLLKDSFFEKYGLVMFQPLSSA